MIDGINCRVHGESLKNIMYSGKLDFKNFGNRKEAKYKGLIITVFYNPLSCFIRGSIHKYFNDGLHNANLFTRKDFLDTIKQLEEELYLYPEDMEVRRIEIGINIPIDYPVRSFIEMITLINGKNPTRIKYGVELKFNQYSIKAYAKSLQYKNVSQYNIIRVEIAYSRMIKFRSDIGHIATLSDLPDDYLWRKMIEVLKVIISKISIFDYTDLDKEAMTIKEQLTFFEWSNPIRLAQEPDRRLRYRQRKRAMTLYKKYSTNIRYLELQQSAGDVLNVIL